MKEVIYNLADYVYKMVSGRKGMLKNRHVNGCSPGGDAQFDIDEVAEKAVFDFLKEGGYPVALYTEDGSLTKFCENPEYIFIIDPIDGTRPAAAGLEMACLSIAVAKYVSQPKIKDIEFAMLKELKTGNVLYSDNSIEGIISEGYSHPVPQLSDVKETKNMFWTIEFNGHPVELMSNAYSHLINESANTGGIFIFNSASYSISRIITGQLDSYVDIGNRILKDRPSTRADFEKVGNGSILHLFPYDIAASVYLALKSGVVITDAYGKSLEDTLLLDIGDLNQQSCIAASTKELHHQLLTRIRW